MAYQSWRYATVDVVRDLEAKRFAAEARRKQEEADRERRDEEAKSKKGGGVFSRVGGFVDAMTPEFTERPAKAIGRAALKGLEYLDKPAEYTLRPVIGAAAYMGAEEKVDPRTGRKYRDAPSWSEVGKGWKSLLTQDPIESYKEGRQAFGQRMEDPALNAGGRFFLGAASDPLSYIGPGAVKAGARAVGLTGKGLATSRSARIAQALIENDSKAQMAGILGGGTAGAYAAEKAGLPMPELTGGLTGGIIGAIGAPRYGSVRGIRRVGEDIATAQGRAGRDPLMGMQLEELTDPKVTIKGKDRSYDFQYEVVDLADADAVIASHDFRSFAEDPRYPQKLQQRSRSDPASRLQVEEMAGQLDPNRMLGESFDLQHGTPIIGPDNFVESGNGRIMALRIAANEDVPGPYQAYVKALTLRVDKLGLSETAAGMQQPALVRRRLTEFPNEGPRIDFVREANESATSGMGTEEAARVDAERISDQELAELDIPEGQNLGTWLLTPTGTRWARKFISDLTTTERKTFTEAKTGALNQAGVQRVKASLFWRVFGGESGEALFRNGYESADPDAKNLMSALERSMAKVAQVEAGISNGRVLPQLSLRDDLAMAAQRYIDMKQDRLPFKTAAEALQQGGLFGEAYDLGLSPLGRALFQAIDNNRRSANKLAGIINRYSEHALMPGRMFEEGQTAAGLFEQVSGIAVGDTPPSAATAPPEAPRAPEPEVRVPEGVEVPWASELRSGPRADVVFNALQQEQEASRAVLRKEIAEATTDADRSAATERYMARSEEIDARLNTDVNESAAAKNAESRAEEARLDSLRRGGAEPVPEAPRAPEPEVRVPEPEAPRAPEPDSMAGQPEDIVAGNVPPAEVPTPTQAVQTTAPRTEAPPPPREDVPPRPEPEAGPAPEPEVEHPGGEFAKAAEETTSPPPPLDTTTAYSTLGLDPGQYDAAAIRNAYRAQARRYHPDLNSSETASADMKAINNAFDGLSAEAAAKGATTGAAEAPSKRAYRSRRGRYDEAARQRAQAEREWRQAWEAKQREDFRNYQSDRRSQPRTTEEEIRGNRPPGEPERVDIPDGASKTVDQLRADQPLGYRLVVTEGDAPYYKRLVTNDTIRELRTHPAPPHVTDNDAARWFDWAKGIDDAFEAFYEAAVRWHPRFNSPTATLSADWKKIKAHARKTFYKAYRQEFMDANGIDPSDWKDLSNADRKGFSRGFSKAASSSTDEIEKQVLREEWYDPLRPDMGRGHVSASDYGMTGEGVTPGTISGEPPLEGGPPPEAPPPSQGRGGTQEFGATEPTDLLRTPTREALLEKGTKNTLGERLGDRLNKFLMRADPDASTETIRRKVNPFINEHRRRLHNIGHLSKSDRDLRKAKMNVSGMAFRDVDGILRLEVDGTLIDGFANDIFEHYEGAGKAGYDQLNDEQKAVVEYFKESNRLINETKQANGAKVQLDPDIEGAYIPRHVIAHVYETAAGQNRVEAATPGYGPSRRVGANRTQSRVFETYEELIKAGFRTDDPWTTIEAVNRAKYLDADDAWLKANLEVLRVNKEPLATSIGFEEIGHPAFNGQLYEPAVARRIARGLEPKEPAIPILADINRILTPLRASFDLSASGQQGLRLWLSNPRAAAHLWWEATRSLVDDTVYDHRLIKMDDRARAIGFENGLTDLISYGNRYTGGGMANEFTLPGDVLAKIGSTRAGKPLAKGFQLSNAHFDRTLNLFRIEMALNSAERIKALNLPKAEFEEMMKSTARAGNRAFGWTDSETSGLEDSLVFAPRYTRAAVETLVKAVSDGGLEGVAARRHMIWMLGEGAALVWTFNTLRGKETTWDPTDPNFLRFRDVAGLDVSPFGTYNTLFRSIAQVVAGDNPTKPLSDRRPTLKPLKRFAEGKLSPSMALAWWPVRGETYLGQPLDWDSPEAAVTSLRELSTAFLPFTVQTTLQEGPLAAGTSALGLSSTPTTPTEKRNWARDSLAQETFGAKYADITGAQKAQVNRDEKITKLQQEADRNTLTRGSERAAGVKATTDAAGKLDALGQQLEAGETTGNDFREQYRLIQAELRGSRDALGATSGGDTVLSGWYDLYDEAEDATGKTDYDKLDVLQEAYRAKFPDVDDRYLKAIGAHDNPVIAEYREAMKVASEYYNLSAYRGMTLEQSRRATSVIMSAQDRVSFGQAANQKHALALMSVKDPEGVALARRALKVGSNPLRSRFRKTHPLLAKYYSDI